MNYRNKISLCNQKLKIYVSFKIKNNISLTTHFLKNPSSSRQFRIFIQITCRKTRIFMQNPMVLCTYLPRQFHESNAVSQKNHLGNLRKSSRQSVQIFGRNLILQNIRLFFSIWRVLQNVHSAHDILSFNPLCGFLPPQIPVFINRSPFLRIFRSLAHRK